MDVDVEVGVEPVLGGSLLLSENLDAEHEIGQFALHLSDPCLATEDGSVLQRREVPECFTLGAQQVQTTQEGFVLRQLHCKFRIGLFEVF